MWHSPAASEDTGGAVTGGCARRRVLAEAHSLRAYKGPADVGSAGPSRGECYLAYFSCA